MGEALQQAPRRLIAPVVGVAVLLAAAAAVAAPAPEAEIVEARLEIETRNAGAGADVLRRRIDERANIVLREAKVLPGDRDDPALKIAVRELDGDDPGYAVTIELRRVDGSLISLGHDRVEFDCPLCTETELVARVEAELANVIEALRDEQELPAELPQETSAPTSEPEQPAADPAPPDRQRPGMLAGGITLLLVGGGSLGAGVGLAIPEPKVDQDNPLDLITTRPVGYALLAGGVVIAVTGAVLTALAVENRRQVAVAPFGDRARAGLVVAWRF